MQQRPHPDLAQVYSITASGPAQITVLEACLPGMTLGALLAQRGCLPDGEALPLLRQLADALRHLHSLPQPVIHRDIKPAKHNRKP